MKKWMFNVHSRWLEVASSEWQDMWITVFATSAEAATLVAKQIYQDRNLEVVLFSIYPRS
jgi:hypothetical protein